MIRKAKSNIHYLIFILIIFGWFLNAKYYYSRFISEGFEIYISFIISISLVLFASLCFTMSKHFKKSKNIRWKYITFISYIFLAIYSINCTTAGQYADMQKINKQILLSKNEQENYLYLIKRYEKKIENAEKEYNIIEEWKEKSIDDLSDRYYYKNTTKTVEEQQRELKEEINLYETKIENLLSENKVSAKSEDIILNKSLYEFYSINNSEKIQFVFQLLLSIFIELIAQISISCFIFFDNKKKIIKHDLSENKIQKFSIHAWHEIMNSDKKSITSKENLIQLIRKTCHDFSEDDYHDIINIALKKGLLRRRNGGYIPDDFVDSNYFYREMCKYFNFPVIKNF